MYLRRNGQIIESFDGLPSSGQSALNMLLIFAAVVLAILGGVFLFKR
jgi:LPXTG-motif cell wall-anchored protein